MSDQTAENTTAEDATKRTCQVKEGDPMPKHDRICFKCEQTFNIEMTEFHRRVNCGCGNNKYIACCGYPPHICDTCAEEGWVGVGGDGGKDHAINTVTDEEKWERAIDIENRKKWAEDGPLF